MLEPVPGLRAPGWFQSRNEDRHGLEQVHRTLVQILHVQMQKGVNDPELRQISSKILTESTKFLWQKERPCHLLHSATNM